MHEKKVNFTDNDTPFSDEYNDIYFSKDNGLEETNHVFIKGNDLPQNWGVYDNVRIAETGFGTGLNFLTTAKLFEETARSDQRLFYTSIEKYPLSKEEIAKSLSQWKDEFGDLLDIYLAKYPIRVSGFHPIILKPNIVLVLIFDDIRTALPEISDIQDFWFLDGFSPAQNPDMWEDSLFENMARLSHPNTRFSTFTSAGFVKRGLEKNGFEVEKINGYGRKREMLTGQYRRESNKRPKNTNAHTSKNITISGAGLAGSSIGYLLNQLGLSVQIFEKEKGLDHNASNNEWGLINPRIGAARIPAYDYFNAAFSLFLRQGFKDFKKIGALHYANDAKKITRFSKFTQLNSWHKDHYDENNTKIFFPDAGIASPKALRDFYLKNLEICYRQTSQTDIIATSYNLDQRFPLQKIRGAISYGEVEKHGIQSAHSYGSYHAPIDENKIVFGATFQLWDDRDEIQDDDHQYNLDNLQNIEKTPDIIGGWVGFRCASKDRIPVIGQHNKTLITTAHGSHGMISSLAGAYILAYNLGLLPQPFSKTVLEALSPARYDIK